MSIRSLVESILFEVSASSWEDVYVPKDTRIQKIWNKLSDIREYCDGIKYIRNSKYYHEWMNNVKELAVFDPDFYNAMQDRFDIDFEPEIDPYDWKY